MTFRIDKKETIKIGKRKVIESKNGNFLTVFEDDKKTGYFYAVDISQGGMDIKDALHVYNVKDVMDRKKPSEIAVAWSANGTKSILFINDYPHAVVDFEKKRAYCKTGFPPSDGRNGWSPNGHAWDQDDYDKITSR